MADDPGHSFGTVRLRPYQSYVVDEALRHARPLIVAPTGSGKTVIASEIIARATDRHVLFLAHRRELILQAQQHLAGFGVFAGVILAGEPRNPTRRVQVASVQTLWARCVRGSADLPPADFVFIDEAHHVTARTYQRLIASYPDATIIGLTATPCRRDGRGLGGTFDALVECPQVHELVRDGHLVPARVFAPARPDLKGVKTRGGDYVESQLAARVDRPDLIGDVVQQWLRLAERRGTVVFATSVGHSIHLRDEFVRAGVRACHLDGATPKPERDEIVGALRDGRIEAVTNCAVLTEGWDCPEVSCCVLARPTKSLGLYRQMVGRVLRPAPGKTDAIVLDHSGAVFSHGLPSDPIKWSLGPDHRAVSRVQEQRNRSDRALLTCTSCGAVRTGGKPCPECGFLPTRRAEQVTNRDGDLVRVGAAARRASPEEKAEWHAALTWVADRRGYKPGWIGHKYKEKFGTWPPRRTVEPAPPSPEVLAWIRAGQLRYKRGLANG
ncbi:hypothetical protein AUC68_11240 [Methyloceanibacter methanicus]|uniref:Helicase n=1 Tax=Methyloceanibacter methanicus TaxID=1774968 RepID=A0A1E3VYT1_9HYPH|nr:hypothetical protein AUC68_11240 [Methyloceanibacter methanicus]